MSNACRIRFEKTGRAIYISHLDLQHTIQRAFIRAGIKIKHTEGFNPHPYMSVALPLSVGIESVCEYMDFSLEEAVPIESICASVNSALPEGILFKDAYFPIHKFKEIFSLKISGIWEYDYSVPHALNNISALFSNSPLIIEKKTKRGTTETDLSPFIYDFSFNIENSNQIHLSALVSAQNPSINPGLFVNALEKYMPDFVPDTAYYRREELFLENGEVFR